MRTLHPVTPRRLAAVLLVLALLSGGGFALARSSSTTDSRCDGADQSVPLDRCASATESDAALPTPFTAVQAFATKSGFRGVVSWAASAPIVPVVHYGTDPANLDQVAPVADSPDTAGAAVLGGGLTELLEVGATYWVSIEDATTGAVTPPIELAARNAYTDHGVNNEQPAGEASRKDEVYTLDLLVQLDAESLPPDMSVGLALDDIAAGVNVFAERLYDAMDGHARVGNVLITDTNVGGSGTTPGATVVHAPGSCDAPGNLADVLVTTAMPFDSHTFSYAIDEPCTPFYLGRAGQLVTPWQDDLHLGYVATHEMMHYAFGAPDLYGTGDVTGTAGGGCANPAWDGSVMHNSGGWAVDHWSLTEVDRDAVLTPCDHAGEPYTWDQAQTKYVELPETAQLEDVFNDRARGNPDGGALNMTILNREPGASTLTHVTPDDTNTDVPCPAGPRAMTRFTDAIGDATSIVGVADGPGEANEPALDIVAEQVVLDAATQELTLKVRVDKLSEAPPNGSVGEWFDIAFSVDGRPLEVVAQWDRSEGAPTFTFGEFDGGRTAIAPVPGLWDLQHDLVKVLVPASVSRADGTEYVVFGPGSTIRGFETTSRRVTGVLVPDADTAGGGCRLAVPGIAPDDASALDATLSAARTTYAFHGGPVTAVETLVAGPVEANGKALDERVIEVIAPHGGTLTARLRSDPTSYATIEISGPGGQLDYAEAAPGQAADVSSPVTSGIYRVTVSYLAAVEATYDAIVTLDPTPLTAGTPAGSAMLSPGQSAEFAGRAPADTAAYECTGPFDPACVTYEVTANGDGELQATVEAGIPADDFDLAIYGHDKQKVASGGMPGTPPGGLESVSAPVRAGHFYVVVQPYLATKDVSTFSLTVALT